MKAPSTQNPGQTGPDRDDNRDKRLADALRENLRRRKAQARAKQGTAKTAADTENQPERSPSE